MGPAGLSGRVALVQGASRGLGLGFVEALLERDDTAQVIATSRDPAGSAPLRRLGERYGERLVALPLDVRRESTIAAAAERTREQTDRLHLLLNCAGTLHQRPEASGRRSRADDDRLFPEKKLEDVRPEWLRQSFEVNAFGPLLVARHFLALLAHDERAVLGNLSARVGSLADNRAGGWYAYRASKAAQNMFTRTLALELRRRAPRAVCVALHPGTVDTELSAPFQGGVPPERLFPPRRAAGQLLAVIDRLGPDDSGRFLAWDGSPIPW